MSSYTPAPIHEWRNPKPWTTCTIDSGTMGAAKASRGAIAATGAEADRLWSTIGRGLAGYTSKQLRGGQLELYGRQPRHYAGSWAVLREHLTSPVAQGMVVYGGYPKLPAAVHDASRQPGYLGLHAIYVENIAGTNDVLVLDPLGKAAPVRVPADSLAAYAAVLSYEHDLYREGEWATVTTITIERSWAPPAVIRFAGSRQFAGYDATNATPRKSVGIGAGGSWAHGDAYALIEQDDPQRAPRGHFVRMVDGALAGLWVPADGLTFPDPPAAIDRAALGAIAGRLVTAAEQLREL